MHLESSETTPKSGCEVANPVAFSPTSLGPDTRALWTLPAHLHRLPRNAVVARVVSGRRPAEAGLCGQPCQRKKKNFWRDLGSTCTYALRPWPWVAHGLVASSCTRPTGPATRVRLRAESEQGCVMCARYCRPPARVMWLFSGALCRHRTQLNWGSYLVMISKAIFVRAATEKHYVLSAITSPFSGQAAAHGDQSASITRAGAVLNIGSDRAPCTSCAGIGRASMLE